MSWILWIVYRTRLVYSVFQWNSQFTVTTSAFETNWTFCENFLVKIIFEDWNIFLRISVLSIGLFSLGKSILTFSACATSLRTASGSFRFDTEKRWEIILSTLSKEVCNRGVACSLQLDGSWQATPSNTKFLNQHYVLTKFQVTFLVSVYL